MKERTQYIFLALCFLYFVTRAMVG